MSATWDRKQKIGFYYGNAAVDLRDSLPSEEPSFGTTLEASHLLDLVERAETQIARIENSQKEISFLISDLKRMIR